MERRTLVPKEFREKIQLLEIKKNVSILGQTSPPISSYCAYVILEHSLNLIYQVPHISAPTIVVDILPAYIIVGQVSIYT